MSIRLLDCNFRIFLLAPTFTTSHVCPLRSCSMKIFWKFSGLQIQTAGLRNYITLKKDMPKTVVVSYYKIRKTQKICLQLEDIFFYPVFLSRTPTIHGTVEEGTGPSLLFFITSVHSRTFAVTDLRCLLGIANHSAYDYQTATEWGLLVCGICISSKVIRILPLDVMLNVVDIFTSKSWI